MKDIADLIVKAATDLRVPDPLRVAVVLFRSLYLSPAH